MTTTIREVADEIAETGHFQTHMDAHRDSVVEDLRAEADRLDRLDAWLAARGLPKDWTGNLDSWGYVQVLRKTGGVVDVEGYRIRDADDDVPWLWQNAGGEHLEFRWDRATPEQRSAALALEAKR